MPWLVWLNGLGTGQQTKGSLVDSQSGNTPGLQAGPSQLGGAGEVITH